MKNKNLIWVGLGAVALYLYFRNKPSASTQKVEPTPSVPTTTKTPPVNTPRPRPKNISDILGNSIKTNKYMMMSCFELSSMKKEEDKIVNIRAVIISEMSPERQKDYYDKQEAYKRCRLDVG
jgi:hypothetical protein